jgi:hypothetical protein
VRTKATLQVVAGLPTHDDAVEHELREQAWSLRQPAFVERLEALRSRISGR